MALDFILAQTKQNIQFLTAQGALTKEDGEFISNKLDTSAEISMSTRLSASPSAPLFNADKAQIAEQEPPSYSATTPSSPEPYANIPPPSLPLFAVKALWGYNEDGKNEKDLSFKKREVIEVVEETNADWWLGRLHGREGLLPSAYVERLGTPPARPMSTGLELRPDILTPGAHYNQSAPSFPTPSGNGHPTWYPGLSSPYPPVPGCTPGHQTSFPPTIASSPQSQQPKKHTYGRLSNTQAHAAAGGVGFGAGSAAGSGIVHSIF